MALVFAFNEGVEWIVWVWLIGLKFSLFPHIKDARVMLDIAVPIPCLERSQQSQDKFSSYIIGFTISYLITSLPPNHPFSTYLPTSFLLNLSILPSNNIINPMSHFSYGNHPYRSSKYSSSESESSKNSLQ